MADERCPRCESIDERLAHLLDLLREVHTSAPVGDLCWAANGCPMGTRWQEHPETCLTRRMVAALDEEGC